MALAATVISAAIDASKASIPWRAAPPDIQRMMPWVYDRLKDRYPGVAMNTVESWLRSCAFSTDHLIVCTRNAMGLFELRREEFGKQWVSEKFVLNQEGHDQDGAALYRMAATWAGHHGVKDVEIDVMSDVPRELMIQALGKVLRRESHWIRVR